MIRPFNFLVFQFDITIKPNTTDVDDLIIEVEVIIIVFITSIHLNYSTIRLVKFQGCLNFVNFMVGLKLQNLTPTTPI